MIAALRRHGKSSDGGCAPRVHPQGRRMPHLEERARGSRPAAPDGARETVGGALPAGWSRARFVATMTAAVSGFSAWARREAHWCGARRWFAGSWVTHRYRCVRHSGAPGGRSEGYGTKSPPAGSWSGTSVPVRAGFGRADRGSAGAVRDGRLRARGVAHRYRSMRPAHERSVPEHAPRARTIETGACAPRTNDRGPAATAARALDGFAARASRPSSSPA